MPSGEQRIEIELEPNRARQMPWADHVRPFSELPWKAIQEAVGFDRHLREVAKKSRHDAAWECIAAKIHYRSGAPRLGEPIFRYPEDAEHGWKRMNCGRGTGHLGTGLYFFGTLAPAYGALLPDLSEIGEAQFREDAKGVWVVDVSSIPEKDVRLPNREKMWKWHDFAKAMICYPGDLAAYRKVQDEIAEKEARLEVLEAEMDDLLQGPDDAPTPDEYYGLESVRDGLWDELTKLRRRRISVHADVGRDVSKIDFDGPRFELPERPGVMDVEPLGSLAQAAVDAYVRDVEERCFPGYHPMTYYMGELGIQAIIQSDWGELNSGDVGCVWYPGAEP